MTKTLFALSCCLAGLLAAPTTNAAPTCGATVSTDVSLTADLVCPAGSDGIVIGADNLRVDLNGYAITTQYVPGTRGVRSRGFKGIKVIGPGRIENFTTAVDVTGGELHEIRDIDVAGPTGSPIAFSDTMLSTIEGNRALVISLGSRPGFRADANRVIGNSAAVIFVNGCDTSNTEVSWNQIRGSSVFVAIGLSAGSRASRVYGNVIAAGTIHVWGSGDNVIEANTISNVPGSYSGIAMGGGTMWCAGTTSFPAARNEVRSNGIMGGGFSVLLASDSYKNVISGNKLYGASSAALKFTTGAEDNDARGNAISNTPTVAIDMGRGNLWP